MIPVRPILSLACQGAQCAPGPKWVRRGATLGAICVSIWPYLDVIQMYAIPDAIYLMSIISIMIGAFFGPILLEMRAYEGICKDAKKAGEKPPAFDPKYGLVMVMAMPLAGILAYTLDVWVTIGLGWNSIGFEMYAVVGLMLAFGLGMIICLLGLYFIGDSWAYSALDVNGDGVVDINDLTAEVDKISSDVESASETITSAIRRH